MNTVPAPRSASAVGVLEEAYRKGVRLWVERGELRYRAPKDALTSEDIERIRVSKSELVALLERTDGATGDKALRRAVRQAPLTFSQRAHWQLYELHEKPAIRQIASATRLEGNLRVDALEESLREIVRRHDALRTQIVIHDGVPTQEVTERATRELERLDLSEMAESVREAEIGRQIEELALQPIDPARDPLFRARLLKMGSREHVLITAMEHMISDGFSRSLFLSELFTAYVQAVRGRKLSLPDIAIQYSDYAIWQQSAHAAWLAQHGGYWSERLRACQRVRFPSRRAAPGAQVGWGTVPVRIDSRLRRRLSEWCRLRHTTLAVTVFTAYSALVLRWCGVSDAVIQYQVDGRMSPKVENTIGYFASVLYLRMQVLESDSFLDLLARATQEYCSAYEHADSSCIEAQMPRPEFAHNTCFNWVPQGRTVDLAALAGPDALSSSPISVGHPLLKGLQRDNEPSILLFDTNEEVVGGVHFPRKRFSAAEIEAFAAGLMRFLNILLEHPETRIACVELQHGDG